MESVFDKLRGNNEEGGKVSQGISDFFYDVKEHKGTYRSILITSPIAGILLSGVEFYSKAAEGGYSVAQNNLGWMYANGCGTEQNYEKAIEWYKKSAENGYKKAYNGIAWTLHLSGRYEEALPWAEKAVAAFPETPYIIDTLASVYQDLGRYDEALEEFELCLKLKHEQNESDDSIHQTEEKIATLKELMKNG